MSSVNSALQALPLGKISSIIDGESSLHIIRVEQRRSAGPATFAEVQDQIRTAILDKKYQEERAAFVSKLREKAYIRTMFDSVQDPSQLKSQ